jgi:hypothetical protein
LDTIISNLIDRSKQHRAGSGAGLEYDPTTKKGAEDSAFTFGKVWRVNVVTVGVVLSVEGRMHSQMVLFCRGCSNVLHTTNYILQTGSDFDHGVMCSTSVLCTREGERA